MSDKNNMKKLNVCLMFRLLFVTTLDGKLSALDMSDNGALKWSIETKPDYLLSSSIHRLEVWIRST